MKKYYFVKYQLWDYDYHSYIVKAENLRKIYEYYSDEYYSYVSARPALENEIEEAKNNGIQIMEI